MAEVFLSEEHVGFLKTCVQACDPAWSQTRVGKEVVTIIQLLEDSFFHNHRDADKP